MSQLRTNTLSWIALITMFAALNGCGGGEIDAPTSESGVHAVGPADEDQPSDDTPNGSGDDQTAPAGTVNVGGATLEVPETWTEQTPSSSFRLAEYTVPGPGGDAGFVIFTGIGGSAQANIDRWRGQFTAPDGGPVEPTVETSEAGPFTVTTVTLQGDFSGGMMNESAGPNTMMVQAIVERSADEKYFLRLLGPVETVSAARDAFDAMIAGLE